jgi:hypothetical protein
LIEVRFDVEHLAAAAALTLRPMNGLLCPVERGRPNVDDLVGR